MQLLAITLTLLALLMVFAAGFFVSQAFERVRRLEEQVAELSQKIEDAAYPRRRTHADTVRLEDLLAFAGDLRDEIEITGLHLDQEHRTHAERMRQLRTIAQSIFENLAEARNSKPTEFPDEKIKRPAWETTEY